MNILSIKTTCIGGFKQDKSVARVTEAELGFETGVYSASLKTLEKLQGFKKLTSVKDSIGDLARRYGISLPGADAVRVLTDDETKELIPLIEEQIEAYKTEAQQFIDNWSANRRVLLDSCTTADAEDKMNQAVAMDPPPLSKFTAVYTLLPISRTAIGEMMDDELKQRAEESFNAATKMMSDSLLSALAEAVEEQRQRISGKAPTGEFKRLTSSNTKLVGSLMKKISGILKGNVSDPDLLAKLEMIEARELDTSNEDINKDKLMALARCESVLSILNDVDPGPLPNEAQEREGGLGEDITEEEEEITEGPMVEDCAFRGHIPSDEDDGTEQEIEDEEDEW